MKHTPTIRAWVIAGIFGLAAAGITQPASANTVTVIGPDGAAGSATHEGTLPDDLGGTWTCSITCYGFVDADDLFDGFEGDEFTDTTDPYVADAFDEQGAFNGDEADYLAFAGGLFVGEPLSSDIDGSTICSDTAGENCSFSSGTFKWIIAQIDGFTSVFEMTGANTLITFDGTEGFGLSHIQGVGVIPIPATLPLFLTGLLGFGFLARRRRQAMEA